MTTSKPSIRSLIAIPAVLTLAVTLARLGLELVGAPAWLANSGLGGTGAILGIAWLPLVFGPWFALKLRRHHSDRKQLHVRLIKTLAAYGIAARLPVVLLTIPALVGEWGTHYEKFPFEASLGAKLGATVGAQLIFWALIWTVLTGWLAGAIALRVSAKAPIEAEPAAS